MNMACHALIHDDSQESWAFMLMDILRPNSGSLQPELHIFEASIPSTWHYSPVCNISQHMMDQG